MLTTKSQLNYFLSLVIILTLYIPFTQASTPIDSPTFSFSMNTTDGSVAHTFIKGVKYNLSVEIDWEQEQHYYANLLNASHGLDIYFGVKVPETSELYTWYNDTNGNTVFGKGYIPLIQNTLNGKLLLSATPHTFTDEDAQGMYSIFVIIVKNGYNPSNPENWYHMQGTQFYYYDQENSDSVASSPGVNPDEYADVIVIFDPAVDIDLSPTPYKTEIIGDIVTTIKGKIDGKIFQPPNSWIRSLTANELVRMNLIKHPEENYYYPIYITGVGQ